MYHYNSYSSFYSELKWPKGKKLASQVLKAASSAPVIFPDWWKTVPRVLGLSDTEPWLAHLRRRRPRTQLNLGQNWVLGVSRPCPNSAQRSLVRPRGCVQAAGGISLPLKIFGGLTGCRASKLSLGSKVLFRNTALWTFSESRHFVRENRSSQTVALPPALTLLHESPSEMLVHDSSLLQGLNSFP